MENETRKIEIDGNVLFHRKNADGTVTLYAEGVFKKAIPKFAEMFPTFFNVLTDPEDEGPEIIIIDPEHVTMLINLGEGKFGFTVCDPDEEDCRECELHDACDQSCLKKEATVDE